jgi:thioredoxin 1
MEDVFEQAVRSGRLVLVDFYATWCGPCMAMMPVLGQLEQELGEQLQFLKIDG